MNRRAFLTGLLATTAAVPIAKAVPVTMTFTSYGSGVGLNYELLNDITRRAFQPRLFLQTYEQSPMLRYLRDHQK